MNRIPITRWVIVLALLLGIAGRGAVPSGCGGGAAVCVKKCCCEGMACCAAKQKQPAEREPAPVQQQVAQDVADAVKAAPFSLLFTFGPTEAKRAPRALFADGHSPEPLAAGCIRLI